MDLLYILIALVIALVTVLLIVRPSANDVYTCREMAGELTPEEMAAEEAEEQEANERRLSAWR